MDTLASLHYRTTKQLQFLSSTVLELREERDEALVDWALAKYDPGRVRPMLSRPVSMAGLPCPDGYIWMLLPFQY